MSRGTQRLIWTAAIFLFISFITRIGLAFFSGGDYTPAEWVRLIVVGFLFDLIVSTWILLPSAIYDALMPEFSTNSTWHRWENRLAALAGTVLLGFIIFVAVAEFTFWEEFSSRFNFIAVDYLIYTNVVIGNILESYPITLWASSVVGASLAIAWFTWPRNQDSPRSTWVFRWARVAALAVFVALGIGIVSQDIAETTPNVYVQQLSNNGIYALISAYRNNELSYEKYYPTIKAADLNSQIRSLVREGNSKFISSAGIQRQITARTTKKDVNIVYITVESLSADFLGVFGNKSGLTPEMDRLARQGLLFTNLYATGTRTVRGLEALSVGTPPTPGQSIVRRPKNAGLENLGEELKENGWTPYWIYGGYGFFDNMNAFFGANGYKVIDRTDADAEGIAISAENIWGIADEDLFSLVIANLDREYARGNTFFAHVMTTSNHRPFTFPENRIDMPQKRRTSAVRYTDWALGDFIRRVSSKPWFKNTLFVIVSDHTAKAAGKTDLPPSRYHIPMIWYGPGLIEPGKMDRLMSQIDVVPTLLGWLGVNYTSGLFGYDIFNLEPGRERAFISTYQKLGYLKANGLVVLDVNRKAVVTNGLPASSGSPIAQKDSTLINEAISWYQSASMYFRTGRLKDVVD